MGKHLELVAELKGTEGLQEDDLILGDEIDLVDEDF